MELTHLTDEALVTRLEEICVEGNRLLARLLVHLGEVEERRIHLRAACSSMFDLCVRRLGMSEGAAFRRIAAARLVRRFPSLLARIERGEIHLSALVLLRDHLTEGNLDELVEAASRKSKREVQELVARHAPRPDVPATIRKLPASSKAPSTPSATATATLPLGAATVAHPAPQPARIEPLAEARYKVQLTATTELRDKLERAKDLMQHRNPSGDLAVVIERALDVLLEKLEKERLGRTARPQRSVRAAKTGRVSRAVRREVFARDGEQCTFTDGAGLRCPARGFLELDHVESRALGGADDAPNLRVRCRAHNLLHAEQVFGREKVERHAHLCQRKSDARAGEPLDVATRGLVNMGFREPAARRALAVVCSRRAVQDPSPVIAEILRDALALLTS